MDERDYWQEYKDGVAMGYIDRDGNQLDPPEPDPEVSEPDLDEGSWEPVGEDIGWNREAR